VDKFVFYDDVNFIKRGWINRNRVLVNGDEFLFSIPLKKASQNKLINEVEVKLDEKWLHHFYMTLEQNYIKAPYYKETLQLIKKVFSSEYCTISDLAIESVKQVINYLGIKKNFERSSIKYSESAGMEKTERLISICKSSGSQHYINPIGGKSLYNKDYFKSKEISLSFIKNDLLPYNQFSQDFISGLSVIDVLMFNNIEETNKLLLKYNIE
jgi:hypothetical protein